MGSEMCIRDSDKSGYIIGGHVGFVVFVHVIKTGPIELYRSLIFKYMTAAWAATGAFYFQSLVTMFHNAVH